MVKNAQSKRGASRQNNKPKASITKRRRRVNRSTMNGERGLSIPAAIGTLQGASRPMMSSMVRSGDLRVRVRHREYITDITGSVLFAVAQYSINPGLALLFPWLSRLAVLFESYLFHALKFQFRTEAPSSQAGKIMLAADWDALDAAPSTKTGMMQERTKADAPVWSNLDLVCDLADLRKFGVQRFIRQGSAPTASDLKTYDVGVFNIASQGVTTAPVIGELWVEYDLELITPNTAPEPASAKIVSGSAVSNASFYGTSPTTTGVLTVVPSANTITFSNVGQYLVETLVTGTLSVITTSTGTATQATAIGIQSTGSGAAFSNVVTVTAPGQTFIYSSPTGTVTSTTTRISQYLASLA
jgi:hypothetical protein